MEEEGTQNTRLLKVIVIVLGILIVIMFALIIGTVIYRLSNTDAETAQPAPATLSSDLPVPAGSSLKAMTPTDRELYLHVEDSGGDDHVYALDRKTGALLWHRQLVPAQ